MLPVEQPYKIYTGKDGKPLNNGYVYFGKPNQNPETSPVTVYWDSEGAIPAVQPLRTDNGYIVRAGTPANVYCDETYSLLVRDSKRRQVVYAKTSDEFSIIGAVRQFATSISSTIGSSLVGFIQSGVSVVQRTVQDKLRDTVSVMDYMTEAERKAVRTNTWVQVNDVSDALDRAAEANVSLYMPPGVYRVKRPWILKLPKQSVYGAGSGVTEMQVANGYKGSSWGGQTRTSLIWHQPPGAYDSTDGWIIGGVIKDMTLNCGDGQCDGIIFNRISQSQLVGNVHIYRPVNGIDNYYGWCHTYKNVYIQGAKVISIILGNGANGTSISGCFLIGWNFANDRTQVHLDVRSGSVGNSFSGGAIELCDAGVRTVGDAQVGIFGTDFEEINYRAVECFGVFSGGALVAAGATSTVQGCSFVGDAPGGMIVSDGACVSVEDSTFINNGPVPTGTDNYALYGVRSGQALIADLPGMGVSAKNNYFKGWGDVDTGRVRKGVVRTIFQGSIGAEDVFIPKKTWNPVLTGWNTSGTVSVQDAFYVKSGRVVNFSLQVQANSIQTTALSSYVTALPFLPSSSSAVSVITGSATNSQSALVFTDGKLFMPTVSNWGNSVIISGSYFTEQ